MHCTHIIVLDSETDSHEYDVKKSRWQGAIVSMSFFLFRLEAYHEELNVHEEMFLLTLAVDQDETAEIDREMRRRGDVESPYVRFHLKTRTLSVE